MRRALAAAAVATAALLGLAGCGSSDAPASSSGAGAGAGGSTTIATATIGSHGVVLIAGSNSMTLYQFAQDVPGSGTSACTGSCPGTWPPLIVPSGTKPSAATGISGQLGTITRSDGLGIQVTYNGRPLHFFSGDTKAGDANGNYPGWSVVAASSTAAVTSSPSASSGGGYVYP
jgi:predicted lipoprotein with Yx(FWY)xxD motif